MPRHSGIVVTSPLVAVWFRLTLRQAARRVAERRALVRWVLVAFPCGLVLKKNSAGRFGLQRQRCGVAMVDARMTSGRCSCIFQGARMAEPLRRIVSSFVVS